MLHLDMPAAHFSAIELVAALPPESLGCAAGDHGCAARLRDIADRAWATARAGRIQARLPLHDMQFVINCTAAALRNASYSEGPVSRTVRLRLSDLLERFEEAVFDSTALAA
jgi:hypothetical protein